MYRGIRIFGLWSRERNFKAKEAYLYKVFLARLRRPSKGREESLPITTTISQNANCQGALRYFVMLYEEQRR
jgi:hypothetical protein